MYSSMRMGGVLSPCCSSFKQSTLILNAHGHGVQVSIEGESKLELGSG